MTQVRRTKIVITLGPALDNVEMLERVILAGAVVFRTNFSHGDIAMHETRIRHVREIAARHEITVAILVDLQGPKIRIGRFKNKKIQLQEGQPFILDTALDEGAGDEKTVSLSYKKLPQD
ncbi:MAG TPA: pyruvate kinase, partial [Gammaproteobacteria bacterium]|nr:pyruvate kinase [Gammaproteobacteria bacterium]